MYLCLFIPAAVIIAMRWHASRDRLLAGLALAYGAMAAASLAAWCCAETVGAMRTLYAIDTAIALAGVPVALRALKLQAFRG
jgi:uncharacterized membrane protein YhaH (DUF805 family)